MKTTTLKAARDDKGRPLLDFLANRLRLSRRKAKDMLDTRKVLVNGRPVWMAHHTLQPGDAITLPASPSPGRPAPEDRPAKLRILMQEGDLLALDKPPGILSNGPDSAESLLRAQTGNPRWTAIHRLDRDTSGCLLFAGTPKVFDQFVERFRNGQIMKLYHALAAGYMTGEGTLDARIDDEQAITRFRVLDTTSRASHLLIRIETGRTHQIRRHLASIRHPVLGDSQYGLSIVRDTARIAADRQMLHAFCIQFKDPRDGKNRRVEAPLPADFRGLMSRLKLT